jgi:hypothetical protein
MLTVSPGTLTPAFNSATVTYTVSVANSVASITISATAAHTAATISGDVGNKAVQVGANTFTVTVTAENGTTTKNYTVVVTRADLPITLTAVTVNEGAFVSIFRTVDLQFTFSGGSPTHYKAGENANLSGAAWQPYVPGALTYSFATGEDGYKTVSARLKNDAGETIIVSDAIYYKPLHTKLSLTAFSINGYASRTATRDVTLHHAVDGGVPTHYSAAETPEQLGQVWRPYQPAPIYTLSPGNGWKDIFFVVANATDTSGTVSAGIYLDESETLESHGLTAILFPNPVENNLQVVIDDERATAVQVTIYSMTGEVYLSQIFHDRAFHIDLSRYPAGIVLVKLSNEYGYTVKRIIKN